MVTGIIIFLLIVANVLVSWKGFGDQVFFDRYKFSLEGVLLYKQNDRLFTSGFLHSNWLHLIFNMFALFIFAGTVSEVLQWWGFLLVYFMSLVGGDLLSLFIHRHSGDYSSVGASGAVSGVIFAAITLVPDIPVGLFFIPMPGWLFGLLYILISIYGIRSRTGNIGHDSHLGGALIGVLVAIALQPSALIQNYKTILIISVPALVFMYLIISRPHVLMVDNFFFKKHRKHYTIDQRYNEDQHNRQQEIDRILDKINKSGMRSLTKAEKDKLEDYSKRIR
ncbi:rhomboid family intramembrane serine protease [Paraflavitalea sp. CAU 1676]|uniref:rhomboid family protein n=1 Tax=Paraflavitalea sp. CAU 1676 TaxID=3032598 RepID=UPI0023DC1D26|nr:rhomboid family intramembrane serine protease [Paraflavitalea sp. CAU 1676]MDF2187813.1 rhomboid family intramembrane serine protease [Paraflavitalea sp. CAU 1676]